MISDERIMGFVEGEGCFSIGIQRVIDRKPRKTRKKLKIKKPDLLRVRPNFRVTIVEPDNKILWEIKETLGVGNIYTQQRKPPWVNASHYYAQSVKECAKVRQFFERQRFYTRKGHDFKLWCQCLDICNSGRHLTEKGLLEIIALRDQMNARKNKRMRSSLKLLRILREKPEHILAHMGEKEAKLIHNKRHGRILEIPEEKKQTSLAECAVSDG